MGHRNSKVCIRAGTRGASPGTRQGTAAARIALGEAEREAQAGARAAVLSVRAAGWPQGQR